MNTQMATMTFCNEGLTDDFNRLDRGTLDRKMSVKENQINNHPVCPSCQGVCIKCGYSRSGEQRYQCKVCDRTFLPKLEAQVIGQPLIDSLKEKYVGQTIGWMQITALKNTEKGFLNKVITVCLCKCNTVFERKLNQIIAAQKDKGTPSCGCYRKNGLGEALVRNAQQRQQLKDSLTYAEQQQVQRILDSRTHKATAIDRREAIECVIRDRQTGDLVCHGGDDDIL